MSWFGVWDGLKNKTCRYLLQRYLGQFLQEKINLEQLKVDLYNGKATLKNVTLKKEALNELLESQGWAVEVISGHIGSLTVTVPWNALMTNDSEIEVTDLRISLRPIKRQTDGTSMLESMWSSVSSSMQLAEECMRQSDEAFDGAPSGQTNSIVGLEKFAETIDNVLNRIKAKLTNTLVRLEYPPVDSVNGIALIIDISDFDYKNETGCKTHFKNIQTADFNDGNDFGNRTAEINDTGKNDRNYLLPTFAKHNIALEGLHIYTEEFKYTNAFTPNIEHTCKFDKHNLCSFESCSTRKIPICEVKGKQNIQVKVKQSEEVNGPKVSLDMELGSFYSFLTPRQIHLLLKFYSAFSEEKKSESSATLSPQTMGREHAAKNGPSEKYLSHGILSNRGNWADDFEETHNKENFGTETATSTVYDLGESMTSSMSSSSTITGTTRFQRKIANMESCGDILNFTIKIASFTGFILHEDIVVESASHTSNSPLNEKSQKDLLEIAEKYFKYLEEGTFEDEFKAINSICNKNHIYLRVKPVIVDGTQQRNKNILVLKFTAAGTQLDFLEVLEGNATPLIFFDRQENFPDGYHTRPELSLLFKSTFSCNFREISLTTFNITLEKSCLELDVSIYDRLSGLLGVSPFELSKFNQNDENNMSNGMKKTDTKAKSSTEFTITTRALDVKLRFPIVDARPIHDAERVPWWKQNIRADFLLFSFYQLSLKYVAGNLEIMAHEIDIFYCEKNLDAKIHLVKANLYRNLRHSVIEPEFEYPKITLNFTGCNGTTTKCLRNNDVEGEQSSTNLPFSSERECRQSDTAHAKQDYAESETILLPAETKELNYFCEQTMKSSKIKIKISIPVIKFVLESKQLFEIIYNRLNSDLFMWEPSSPILKGFQQDDFKCSSFLGGSLMDSIYVPSIATSTQEPYKDLDQSDYDNSQPIHGKNNISMDIESQFFHSSEANVENISNSIYFSTYKSHQLKVKEKPRQPLLPSKVAVDIKIGAGQLALFVPVRDNDNHVLPEQLGKFDLRVKGLKIFSVNGYNNCDNLAYLVIQLSDVEVYHCGLVPACASVILSEVGTNVEPFMKSTFYKVPIGLTKGRATGNNKRELLSLVIELKKLTEQRVKRLRIATGIQMATLRFSPAPTSHIWLNQLRDYLDVLDFPIEGYKPYGVVTELHLNLWDCAIDYRPKNLPYRSVMEINSFTMSSNIVSTITSCNVRFIVDECILSIAPYNNSSKKYPDSEITVISASTLIPVIEVGLLDISIRVCDKITEKSPQLDFRCSIHDIHIRTCSDSGSALAKLLTHLANDGEIEHLKESEHSNSTQQSSVSFDNEIFGAEDEKINSEITKKQQERINLMMADALNETVTSSEFMYSSTTQSRTSERAGIEVFYFPDENKKKVVEQQHVEPVNIESEVNELCDIINFESNVMLNSMYERNEVKLEDHLPQIKQDFGDVEHTSMLNEKFHTIDLNEKEYLVIPNEEKLFKPNGIKNVNFKDTPLRIVDNHFCLPTGNTDLLKPPENFPMPVMRYTLCEMTLTWHMYGGHDFLDTEHTEDENKYKAEKSKMSDAYRHGVSYAKSTQGLQFNNRITKEKLNWKTIGGPTRNHDVLVEMQFTKVRLSHEIYPTHTSQASRQVLLVSDFEVRDRLKSSDIKKFLYHPKKNFTNKSSQHMIVIKALHVRPNPDKSATQECSLRVSLLPLRLHIDQDTLIFLVEFFAKLGDNCSTENDNSLSNGLQKQHEPLMDISDDDDVPEAVQDLHARRMVTANLDILIDEKKMDDKSDTASTTSTTTTTTNQVPLADEASPIYFREIVFSPEVPVCLDYHGRRIELSRGPIAGLLMGLGQLQCSEVRLRKLVYRRGLLGFEKLFMFLCKEWLSDIKRNQLPKILSGVGPTYAFVQLFQGIYDLFWLPIEQYQKDGRIIRGLQLGAQSFTARTALATLELTSRVIQLLQFTAETTFDMVSAGPSVRRSRKLQKGKKKRPYRPKDIREGVTNAYLIVKEGINDSANTLIETAVAEHDQKGYSGAVGAVMRQIPQLVVCPAVLATQATTNILGGVKSSLVPEAKMEAREKWKDDQD